MSDYMEEQMLEMGNTPEDNTCWVCGEDFETEEQHNFHYKKCADKNVKTEYSREEVFGLVNNKNNY